MGCHVFCERINSIYFEDLTRKIAKRFFSWRNKFLYLEVSRCLLIMCFSLYHYTCYHMCIPQRKSWRKFINFLLNFFRDVWEDLKVNTGCHGEICVSQKRKVHGIGFKLIHDINNPLFAKLWWNFRVSITLYGSNACEISIARKCIQ